MDVTIHTAVLVLYKDTVQSCSAANKLCHQRLRVRQQAR